MSSIHFHTDCDYFAGCENMITILTNSAEMRSRYKLSLSFRYSSNYQKGLDLRIKGGIHQSPLQLRVLDLNRNYTNTKLNTLKALIRSAKYTVQLVTVSVQNFLQLYKTFSKTEPDILHINNGGYPGAFSCRIAVVAGYFAGIKKIVMVVNNMAIPYNNYIRKIDFLLDRIVAKKVNVFITGSETAAKQLKRVLKLKDENVIALPNGVEIRPANKSRIEILTQIELAASHHLIFGMIGVMLPRKGHLVLFEAISSLHLNPSFIEKSPVFLIEGEGGYVQELKSHIQDMGISKFVRFIGAEENIYNLYTVLDYLVYPSVVDEDFPNVISEALGMGIPVVASKVAGAIDQIQDGVQGFLFEKGSSAALSATILKICNNFDSYQQMKIEARKKYELYYTPDKAVQRYLQLYARC